jgi:hypothetical protein
MIKIEYEILYAVPFKQGHFRSHASGKPDIRTRICESERALHRLNTSSHYHYEVRKVWEISDEEYEKAMSQAKSKHDFLKKHCGY